MRSYKFSPISGAMGGAAQHMTRYIAVLRLDETNDWELGPSRLHELQESN